MKNRGLTRLPPTPAHRSSRCESAGTIGETAPPTRCSGPSSGPHLDQEGVCDTRGDSAVFFFCSYNSNVLIRSDWGCLLPDSFVALEQQRSSILTQIVELDDFRSGSITAINGRCGKPNCHCHQPNQPGHGPNFRLTRKINGKTVSESFPTAAELHKALREVEAFHRFRQLSQELLEVNESICRARPVADTFSPEEKKRRKPSSGKSRTN